VTITWRSRSQERASVQSLELAPMADAGDLHPDVDATFTLAVSRAAFERSTAGGKHGRRYSECMTSQEQKGAAFQALHENGAFVIPNPWDAGSARVLSALGFKALATTSSGFAFTLGRLDGTTTLDEVVAHAAAISRVSDLPLSVDLENGYGSEPAHAALAIQRIADAGAVGGSIEDYDPSGAIYPIPQAVERIAAAVEAARALHFPFTLTARAENHIRGNPNLADTIDRLQAFAAAGADVLYAPGLRTLDEIRTLCAAVAKPVNVLAVPGLSLSDVAAAGARRVSVGGSLTWVAVRAMADAAMSIRDDGNFAALSARLSLQDWFQGGSEP